jgi:hypothetical protein
MRRNQWLGFVIGSVLVLGELPALVGEVLVCAFTNEKVKLPDPPAPK